MNANELRIENWIRTLKGNEQVVDVMCDSVNTMQIHGELYENIEPIPLTEEWMQRFGLFPDYKSRGYSMGNVLVIFWPTGTITIEFRGVEIMDIKYVHTFQNIMSLLGTELTIKK